MGWLVSACFSTVLPVSPFHSTPVAVLDAANRIMTVLAGRPRGDDWEDMHTRMSSLMEHAGDQVQNARPERRGNFVSISTGVSYGGGQMVSASHKLT